MSGRDVSIAGSGTSRLGRGNQARPHRRQGLRISGVGQPGEKTRKSGSKDGKTVS